MEKYIEPFLDTIHEYMETNNLSPSAFADKIGCLDYCVTRWLRGINIPSLEYVIMVADYFKCSVDYLFRLKDNENFSPAVLKQSFQDRFNLLFKTYKVGKEKVTKLKLADLCGVGSSCVSKWAKHGQLPNPYAAIKLAEFFNVSIDYLIGRSDQK